MAYSVISPPKPLNLYSSTLPEDFKIWKKSLKANLIAAGYDSKPKKQQTSFIKCFAGQDIAKASKEFQYEKGEDEDDPDLFLAKIEECCRPMTRSMSERGAFDNIRYIDNFERFLMQVIKQANLCHFADKEERVKYKIISSVPQYLMKSLIKLGDPSLKTIIQLCRESLNPDGAADSETDKLVEELVSPSNPASFAFQKPLTNKKRYTEVEGSFHEPLTGTRKRYQYHLEAERRSMNTPAPIIMKNKEIAEMLRPGRTSRAFRHPIHTVGPEGFQSVYSLWYTPFYKAVLLGEKPKPVPESYQSPLFSNYRMADGWLDVPKDRPSSVLLP